MGCKSRCDDWHWKQHYLCSGDGIVDHVQCRSNQCFALTKTCSPCFSIFFYNNSISVRREILRLKDLHWKSFGACLAFETTTITNSIIVSTMMQTRRSSRALHEDRESKEEAIVEESSTITKTKKARRALVSSWKKGWILI